MKETSLRTIKNIYETVFNLSNIYDDILNRVMGIYSGEEISYSDLLSKMNKMLENMEEAALRVDEIILDVNKYISEVEGGKIIDKDELQYLSDLQQKVAKSLIGIVNNSHNALKILYAYIVKVSSVDYLLLKERIFNNSSADLSNFFSKIDELIQKDEEVLYEELIDRIKVNINDMNNLIESLKKFNYG